MHTAQSYYSYSYNYLMLVLSEYRARDCQKHTISLCLLLYTYCDFSHPFALIISIPVQYTWYRTLGWSPNTLKTTVMTARASNSAKSGRCQQIQTRRRVVDTVVDRLAEALKLALRQITTCEWNMSEAVVGIVYEYIIMEEYASIEIHSNSANSG